MRIEKPRSILITGLLGGDSLFHRQSSYDMDKEAAVKARKYFLQYAKDNQLTMAGMHLPAPAFK